MFTENPYKGTWEVYFDMIVRNEQVMYGAGAYYDWLADWNENRAKAEMLFLKYEDLKRDIVSGIKKIAAFLYVTISDAVLQKIVHDVNIKQMKVDEAIVYAPEVNPGGYISNGQCGEWKKYFTVEQNECFDSKYKKLYDKLSIDINYN